MGVRLASLAMILTVAIVGRVSANEPIAASVFAERPTVTNPEISPDGKHIAARSFLADKWRLVVVDADHPETTPSIFDVGDRPITDLNWAGDSRVLITISTPGILGLPSLRLVVADLQARTIKLVDQESRGLVGGLVLHTDAGGGWALISSQSSIFETPSVKRVDLATGNAVVIEKPRPDVWNWYADDRGVVRAGIAYEDRRWKIWYRTNPTDPLVSKRGKLAKEDDSSVDSMRFMAGDQTGIIVTNGRTGRFGVYKYDINTGEIGSTIYEHPTVDVTSIIADPITGAVSGIRYEDDRRRIAWIDPEMTKLQQRVERALPNAENVIVGQSKDKNRVLIQSAGADRPDVYYLLDRAAKRMTPVLQPFGKLADVSLTPVVATTYKARDGLVIPAYLALPRGQSSRALPLIVMPHGGPFARDSWEYDPFVQFLTNRGYAVLQPQFRGSTGYGRDFVERGYGEWGRKMQDDLDDGVDWLVSSGKVDAHRVCIMGASYGGYAALWGAIRNPERYRCAISMAGVTDLASQIKYDRKSFSAPRYFKRWQTIVKGSEQKEIELSSVSPVAQAARLTVPVLIAHGEKDENVPPSQAKMMIDALKRSSAKSEVIMYKDEGHGFEKKEDLEDYLKHVEAFLMKYNPA